MQPDIYHVTPITPNAAMLDVCTGRNLMVSFYRPDQLAAIRKIAKKRMADNGRFSEWMAALKRRQEWSEDNLDNRPYYEWLEPWIDEPETLAIMPDIPGAPSQLNDGQLLDWPFKLEKGVPVYHMDGPTARLGRLLEKYPLVAIGWIGHPKKEPVGCPAYWRRIEELERELGGPDIWMRTHMLRGVAVARGRRFPKRGQQQPRSKRTPIRFPHGQTVGRTLARAKGLRRSIGENSSMRQDEGSRARQKSIYLCGPINGCTDEECTNWREDVKLKWSGRCIDPMVRDYRGREAEAFREIVELDKIDVAEADIILVNYDKPSVGTSMEILYAWERGKRVIVACRQDAVISPWLRYHSHHLVHGFDEAMSIASAA